MTRSVYLLAFIASATVVSAEMTWTLSDQAACAALGARGCDYEEYTKKTSTTYDRKDWEQTETDCNAQSNSCVFQNNACYATSTAANNHNTVLGGNLFATFRAEASASILKCYNGDAATYSDSNAVGQTKTACEAAGSDCVWSWKEDTSPATDDHMCNPSTNTGMALYTANNIPAPYKAIYQWVSVTANICVRYTDDECNADARCILEWSSSKWECTGSEPNIIGLMADACPSEAAFYAKLLNITVADAKAVAGVSPAGDVSRGALLFAALAALLALVM